MTSHGSSNGDSVKILATLKGSFCLILCFVSCMHACRKGFVSKLNCSAVVCCEQEQYEVGCASSSELLKCFLLNSQVWLINLSHDFNLKMKTTKEWPERPLLYTEKCSCTFISQTVEDKTRGSILGHLYQTGNKKARSSILSHYYKFKENKAMSCGFLISLQSL